MQRLTQIKAQAWSSGHSFLEEFETDRGLRAESPRKTQAMSHFLDRLTFFRKNVDTFSGGHGIVTAEDRSWEDGYRKRWQHDKIVRSTHGVNCTGSCSWKVYVKGGIVTWETQQTDYPRTRPELPNHEPVSYTHLTLPTKA